MTTPREIADHFNVENEDGSIPAAIVYLGLLQIARAAYGGTFINQDFMLDLIAEFRRDHRLGWGGDENDGGALRQLPKENP